jgi:heme exporter protein D
MDLDLGKYADFIAPAFLATGVVMAGLILDSVLRARKWRREAERLQAEKDARKGHASA